MFKRIAVVALVLVSIPAVTGAEDPPAPKDIVLAMIDAVNERDFDALDLYVAADVRRHSAATPGVTVESLADFKAFLHQDLAAVPDATQRINMIFESGDMVAVHATYSGTQSGQMGPFPPSNKPLEIPFIGILRVQDGKIAELWVEWDNLNGLMQLGHFPPPESSRGPSSNGE
jgi:predicted ester cyclase